MRFLAFWMIGCLIVYGILIVIHIQEEDPKNEAVSKLMLKWIMFVFLIGLVIAFFTWLIFPTNF